MRAITVVPGKQGSARLDDLPEPDPAAGAVLVQALALGVCGTDLEITGGRYGWAPPGRERLVLGHESLGRVIEAPGGGELARGDLVAGIVRHPDPVPCKNCAIGEWDMCRNGRYTEHGIKELDGFGSERWRIQPEFAVKINPAAGRLGVLLEPATIVVKAWEHVERIGRRARWEPRRVLITGAGPIGLLAALLGKQRGLDVHVLDRVTEGPKPDLVAALGAVYHHGSVEEACRESDVVIECTGVGRSRLRRHAAPCAERDRLPYRSVVGRPLDRRGRRGAQPRAGALQRGDRRLRQRQPAPLPVRRRGARQIRPRLARPPDHPPGPTRPLPGGAGAAARRRQGRRPVRGVANRRGGG